MINLVTVLNKLSDLKDSFKGSYYIPEIWNSVGFKNITADKSKRGQISINPYEFIAYCIKEGILSEAQEGVDYLSALKADNPKSVVLNKSTIYSMLPRMFTAWDHQGDGKICSGTFLKAICLLPYLKKMNINIIYLLPIFEYSDKHKKGELGSPYAIKNIYKLDNNLHDDLLGKNSEDMVNLQFKAFVEACHILGIKVMVDFVFRTCARDNDFILEHPDWFYWIDKDYNDQFSAPVIESMKGHVALSDESVKILYQNKNVKEYLCQFRYDPQTINPDKWANLVKEHKKKGTNIVDLIEDAYNITTVPGFSDVINDSQPPWTDVTFYRFYFDVNEKIAPYLDGVYPPFVLQDAIKSNLYPGKIANEGLWEYISNVMPYYQVNFGIDGARIDMGHALPSALNVDIISKAKRENPDFILWSEEFHAEKSAQAKDDGFHFISGSLWSVYPKVEKHNFNKKLLESLCESVLPVAAALETPDTPRAALVNKSFVKLELLVMLNYFVPNVIPFVNNGFEVMEIQPMNLGLGNTDEGKFVLPISNPMYGKMAFFDNYRIHWLNRERDWMFNLINKVSGLRHRFIDILSNKDNFIEQEGVYSDDKCITLSYFDKNQNKGLFLIGNRCLGHGVEINIAFMLPQVLTERSSVSQLVYFNGDVGSMECNINDNRVLLPGEVIIGTIN